MNSEGRTQRGGRVPAKDFGDGCNDKEARVACLGNDSEDSFVTASEGLEERDHSALDCTAPLEGQAELDRIGSWGMHVEAAAEEIICMETEMFENVGPAACIGSPKRPIQTADQARPSNVLRFESDQRGIGSYRRSVEGAEEEIQCIEENDFGNVGPAAYTGPQKRPTLAAGHGGPSFVQRFGSDQQRIDSYRRSMEAAEEEVLTVGKSVSGNARPPACTRPPRMPAQTAGYAGPSSVLRFASDQRGIANYKMFVEAAEEEVQCMGRNRSRNVRSVACSRPPKRPAQTVGHAGPSDVLCFGSD